MNHEHKSLLQQAIISQTCNKQLANAIITAIEDGSTKTPKTSEALSPLQRAIYKEKSKTYKTGPSTGNEADE